MRKAYIPPQTGHNMGEKLAILDAGAQYGKVIDRRVREASVASDILPLSTPATELGSYQAIIISGGPESVYADTAPAFDPDVFNLGIPVLGICYGMQLMNFHGNGQVRQQAVREEGPSEITVENSRLFSGLEPRQRVLLTHGDSLETIATGYQVTATSQEGIPAAIEDETRGLYGVQFHPETDLTENGQAILRNFLFGIAGFSGTYTVKNREESAIAYIRDRVGDDDVLVLVSGGVDSTVCAALVTKTLGPERVHALHIDNGFMRYRESEEVAVALDTLGLKLHVVDASSTFYGAPTENQKRLDAEVHPEAKRKAIGDTFMKVAKEEMRRLNLDPERLYLAQGTLRPDLIESASEIASGNAQVIKTHHNDTEAVRVLRRLGRVIEPLHEYHKDEVRHLGEMLGLPRKIVWRHPFPGPGLAIRIICADEPHRTEDFDRIQERLKSFATKRINATLLPFLTVGVQGDGRSYSYLAALSGNAPWPELFDVARRIPRRVHEVNRVAYVFGSPITEPITTFTPTHLTPDVIRQLQCADRIVTDVLREYDLIRKLSQVPVISFPISFDEPGKRSIGLRPFITNDFMTGQPAVPGVDIPEEALDAIVERILADVDGISRVALDLTTKPPGTTEWE